MICGLAEFVRIWTKGRSYLISVSELDTQFDVAVLQLATEQLYAYMIHIASQITVKALKEGKFMDFDGVYGLAFNSKKKIWLVVQARCWFLGAKFSDRKFGEKVSLTAIKILEKLCVIAMELVLVPLIKLLKKILVNHDA